MKCRQYSGKLRKFLNEGRQSDRHRSTPVAYPKLRHLFELREQRLPMKRVSEPSLDINESGNPLKRRNLTWKGLLCGTIFGYPTPVSSCVWYRTRNPYKAAPLKRPLIVRLRGKGFKTSSNRQNCLWNRGNSRQGSSLTCDSHIKQSGL